MKRNGVLRAIARVSVSVAMAIACWHSAPLAAGPQQRKAAKPAGAAKTEKVLTAARPGRRLPGGAQDPDAIAPRVRVNGQAAEARTHRVPREQRMRRAGSFDGDVRTLPQGRDRIQVERPEREGPAPAPGIAGDGAPAGAAASTTAPAAPIPPSIPAPPPSSSFDGLDFANWGNGHPPDTNGDVGPELYIQTINTSLGIYRKSDGARLAAFSFNTFMSAGHFGNLCDTNNFGDPVVLYDTFEDRWVITDFAFKLDAAGNVVNPPGSFQCFAVSKTGDPLAGGWNYYSVNTVGGLGDYPKFGVWPDGIYMSANMFNYAAGGSFQNPRVYAFNKAQMYAGAASIQVISFDAPAADFTILPSNARLQAGTPPSGTPNYFLSSWEFLNALTIYKFHVDWDRTSLSTFTGPDVPISATGWPGASVPNAQSLGGNSLDVLQIRAMMQNQYSNIGGAESLWAAHTVRRANTSGLAAPRWYQVTVTGGVVAPTIPQATTWDPDGANVISRFMPSVAVDRAGDLALGYSTSNNLSKPAIKYAGRLATDPVNSFSLSEQLLIQGTGTQVGNCGTSACTRWGDYSAMSLDPDGCTFWYTNMYYAVDGLNHQTRIGSFAFPSCAPTTPGALQGTVTNGSSPLAGVTVSLGSRTATTDGAGFYSFPSLPAGTYPSIGASLAGYATQTFSSIAVADGTTAVRDFVLAVAPTASCLVDTTEADFQRGVATACDTAASPGDVILLDAAKIDQQNLTVTSSGFGMSATAWAGQTFTPAVTGRVTRIDLDLFCSGCTGTTPNLAVSIRATTGATPVPTGPDLATSTIAGFSSGAGGFFSAAFASPVTLTAGTRYAVIVHPVTNPSPVGTYAYVCSCAGTGTVNSNPYANGQRVTSGDSGGTWAADTTVGGRDLGFKVFVKTGFPASGVYDSSVKDANPAGGSVAAWSTISWTATVPGGTSLSFQAAASNSPTGPFTFVGPDGTAATSFSNGASLAQFNGQRYLKYRASLGTSSAAATPTINDVTICFANAVVTSLSLAPASATYGGATTLAATLTGGAGVAGKSIAFTVNGVPAGSAVTDGSGVATETGVDVSSLAAGSYPIAASFAGDGGFTAATASNTLTIAKAAQTILFAPLPDRVATDPPFTVSATGGGSGNPVTFSTSSTACSVSAAGSVTLLAAGSCAIDADQAGNANYEAAPRVTQGFTVTAASQTITFPPIASFTWLGGSATLAATASSGLAVGYSVLSGPCAVSGSTLTATAAGSCVVAADQPGDARYDAAAQVTATATVDKAPQAIAFAALPDRIATDAPFTVSASGGGSGNPVTFSTASTACSVSGGTVTLLAAGACAIDADQAGNGDYLAAPRVTRGFTIAFAPQTITFAAIAPRTFGDPDFAVAPTASSGLPVSLAAAGSCTLLGTTVHITGVGTCAITATQPGNARYGAAAPVTRAFPILYASGQCLGAPAHSVLPPLAADGSSVNKQGSTIPVKFRVCDVNGVSIGTPGVVTAFRLVQIVTGAVTSNVDQAPAATNGDTAFRWDSTDRLWIFNLSTKPLAAGSTYVYRITLADGTSIEFRYTLR